MKSRHSRHGDITRPLWLAANYVWTWPFTMSRIFLSHSSTNNAQALALASWLSAMGWQDHFLDISERRGIDPGERWMAALADAVDRCEAVVFLVSPAWRDSKYCFAEFYQARSLGKRVFGVVVEPIALSELPEQLTSEWQVCDLCSPEASVSFTVERLPTVPRTEVRFPAFGLDALARGLRKAGLDPSTFIWPPEHDPDRPPYPGLRALEEADAAVFFGREAAIVRAIDQIRCVRERDVERLFVVLGGSGAGKSSFLRAGLLPRLRRDDEHLVVLPPIRPERAAISGANGLLAALASALGRRGRSFTQARIREALHEHGLGSLLRELADTGSTAGRRTVLVPIDQAEELFGADGRAEADALLDHIESLMRDWKMPVATAGATPLRILVVFAMRSDALPKLQSEPRLQRLAPVLFSLPAMPATEFKSVIEGPARRHTEAVCPLEISPGLIERLVADAAGADALPLLALTLQWLYREFSTPQGTRIGRVAYERIGGVRGVIQAAVSRAFERPAHEPVIPATESEQARLLERVFPHIATVDPESGEAKRRVASRSALRREEPEADALVSRLVEQRLLVSDARPVGDGAEVAEVVEVAHEALLRQWDALDRWLGAFAADLAACESIRRSAADWHRRARDEALLLHTAHRLGAAEALLGDERLRARFEPVDAEYVRACRQRERLRMEERDAQLQQVAEQQAARTRLQRRATVGLSAVLVVLIVMAVWIAKQARDLGVQNSLTLAAAAQGAAEMHRYDRSVRLAVLAARATWWNPAHPAARPVLFRAADSNRLRSVIDASANSVGFSSDGTRVVTAWEDDGAVRVWDAETGSAVGSPMWHGGVRDATISNDGTRVATASKDGTVRIWDATSSLPLVQLVPGGVVSDAQFSTDGRLVVTASLSGTAQQWDSRTGDRVGPPMQHGGEVYRAVFVAGGAKVFTVSGSAAHVWDAVTGRLVVQTPAGVAVASADMSMDGKRIGTATEEGTVRVWDAETGLVVGRPMQHRGRVHKIAFSPDGARLVTASADGTARVWDAASGSPIGEPMTHDREVFGARFAADGTRVATASEDRTARVWDAATGKPLGPPLVHDEPVAVAQFSANGRRLVTMRNSSSAGVSIWDVRTGETLGGTLTHWSASFSTDGRSIVTASADQTARVWDTESGKQLAPPLVHTGVVKDAEFDPTGKFIVTASADMTARVWDVAAGRPVGVPMAHSGEGLEVRFSVDGTRVLTSVRDGYQRKASAWEASSGKPVGARQIDGAWVEGISSDGKSGVTVPDGKEFRVWNLDTGVPIGPPFPRAGPEPFALSSDGRLLLTVSAQRSLGEPRNVAVQVWSVDTGQPLGPVFHSDGFFDGPDSFSPDGTRVLATSIRDCSVQVWDIRTGTPAGPPMKVGSGCLAHASFSPDGQHVLTVSSGAAALWDVQTGLLARAPISYDGGVFRAQFSPDGRRIVTISEHGIARIWAADGSARGELGELVVAACSSMNQAARRLTSDDLSATPILARHRVGEDVCAGVPGVAAR